MLALRFPARPGVSRQSAPATALASLAQSVLTPLSQRAERADTSGGCKT
jgi:hypothetical protein